MNQRSEEQHEVLIELIYTAGRSVKVIAIDPDTGTEVVMVGDKNQSEEVLKRLAARKLHYVLGKNQKSKKN